MTTAAFGVPLEGGPSDAFTRERASATPLQPARTTTPQKSSAELAQRPPVLDLALRPLQEWIASAIMDASDAPAGIDDIQRVVLPSRTLSSAERLDIYRLAYRARLVECLADDYPILQHALGEATFEALCHAYIDHHPSRSPNLNGFGRHLAAFCRERPGEHPADWQIDGRAELGADLATLEWAMVEVLHAAPAARLSLEELASIEPAAWASACFTPSATVRVLELGYPVGAYLQSVRIGEEPDLPGPAWAATAVFRDGATIWRMDLSRAMHRLLSSLFRGDSLGTAFDALGESGLVTDDQAPQVMAWFRDWVGHGIFGSICIAPKLA